MITPRLFVGDDSAPPVPGDDYALAEAQARHVAQVLRMRAGDAVALFTGDGGEYPATIRTLERRAVVVHVDRHDPVERESPWAVTLAQAVVAADMMDLIVRKAVELGVVAIVPVQSARSQNASAERVERRLAHWRRIVIAACEQCGRNRIPAIAPVVPFAAWLAGNADAASVALLDAGSHRSLHALASNTAPRTLAIGPEGGFDAAEISLARAAGVAQVHLGARMLRAETAALAALAIVGACAGDAR